MPQKCAGRRILPAGVGADIEGDGSAGNQGRGAAGAAAARSR